MRLMFEFSLAGDLRFISHHDCIRLFKRALARAGLPVKFSGGFNPQPKLSLPLPRPVGVASQCDALVVDFDEPVDADDARSSLDETMPEGIRIARAVELPGKLAPQPQRVAYSLAIDTEDAVGIGERASELISAESAEVVRRHHKTGRTKRIDVRSQLESIAAEGDRVEFVLLASASGSARPAEVAELLGIDPAHVNHRIERLWVRWGNISDTKGANDNQDNQKDHEGGEDDEVSQEDRQETHQAHPEEDGRG